MGGLIRRLCSRSRLLKLMVAVGGWLLVVCNPVVADQDSQLPDGLLLVEVAGVASEEGILVVAVFDSDDTWLGDSPVFVEKVDIQSHLDDDFVVKELVLPIGEYALSVFYDVNGNGELDTNFIGLPKEPIAISNNAISKFGPPKYAAAKFVLQLEPVIQRLTLRAY